MNKIPHTPLMNKEDLELIDLHEAIKKEWLAMTANEIPHKIANGELKSNVIFVLDTNMQEGTMFIDESLLPADMEDARKVLSDKLFKLRIVAYVAVAFAEPTEETRKRINTEIIEDSFIMTSEAGIITESHLFSIVNNHVCHLKNFGGVDNYFISPYTHLIHEAFSVS